MTADSIEKMFLHPVLTKIAQDGEKPNYTSIKQLKDELISNAVAVPSDLGDGLNGHLFLVISENEYSKATTQLKPSAPIKPTEPVPVSARTGTRSTPINYDNIKEEFREYTAANLKYFQYHNTSRCLVKQILGAVPMIYIQELSDPITKFGNVEPHTIIEHLQDNYGTVTSLDLDENEERMKAPWSPPQPIEELYIRLIEGKRFADKAGDTMEHSTLVRAGYKIIHANGLFTQACYEWRKVLRTKQTWQEFKIHFAAADKDRSNNKTMEDAGFHNANNATDEPLNGENSASATTEMSALCQAISAQTATNQENFTKMMELLQVKKGGNGGNSGARNQTANRTLSYCWTHGRSDNLAHTGETCNNKATGHVETATWKNKVGGSDKDYSKKE